MSYADVLLSAPPSASIGQTCEAAADFVEIYGGRLTVAAYAWPRASALEELVGGLGATTLREAVFQDALGTTRAISEDVFARRRIAVDWCSGLFAPDPILANHLLAADLAIVGPPEDGDFAAPNPIHLCVASGGPILRLASDRPHLPFANVLIAWKDSAQSRRAVHDALPLLRRATKVLVVGIGDEVGEERLAQLAEHLVGHDVPASCLHEARGGAGVCDKILRRAEADGSDLIVSGAYSRSRASERILGGVTRELLQSTRIPWLFAH